MENKTPLEKHIEKNRNQLDVEQSPDGMWEAIEAELDPQVPDARVVEIKWMSYVKVAAMICIAVGVSLIAGMMLMDRVNPSEIIVNEANEIPVPVRELDEEFRLKQVKLIDEVNRLDIDDAEYMLDYSTSIQELETNFTEILAEFEKNPNSDKVLEALIANYTHRLMLLQKLQETIHREHKSNVYETNI